MPLLDHFHPPLHPRRHWESFHVNWAGAIADALNQGLLPEGYFAEEQAHAGARVEIDVATFADANAEELAPQIGGVATVPARVWAPPAPAFVMPAAFPDRFEVLVFEMEGGANLVAAIELISPANKDRASHRQAFAVKCASYLQEGVGLLIIDIVTSRQANLHNDMIRLLGHDSAMALPADALLYAVAYRPIVRDKQEQVDVWTANLKVGQALPVMPLALNAVLSLPIDLEATYLAACQRRRLV
jgi:Protein of unknown function (DUF4058)